MNFLSQRDDVKLTVFDVKSKKTEKIFKPYLKHMTLVYGDITNKNQVLAIAKNQRCSYPSGCDYTPASR